MALAMEGDAGAARLLVDRHAGGIYAYAYARVGSVLAGERTPEIFTAAIETVGADSFVDGSIATWLLEEAIANLVLKDASAHDPRLAKLAQGIAADAALAAPAPEEVAEATTAAVIAAAATLPPDALTTIPGVPLDDVAPSAAAAPVPPVDLDDEPADEELVDLDDEPADEEPVDLDAAEAIEDDEDDVTLADEAGELDDDEEPEEPAAVDPFVAAATTGLATAAAGRDSDDADEANAEDDAEADRDDGDDGKEEAAPEPVDETEDLRALLVDGPAAAAPAATRVIRPPRRTETTPPVRVRQPSDDEDSSKRSALLPIMLALLLIAGALTAFALTRDGGDPIAIGTEPTSTPEPTGVPTTEAPTATSTPSPVPSPTSSPTADPTQQPTTPDPDPAPAPNPNPNPNPDPDPTDDDPPSSPQSPPVAGSDSVTVGYASTTFIDVLANDTDPDGNLAPGTLRIVQAPAHGDATVLGGRIRYTADSDIVGGFDLLRYEVCDTTNQCARNVLVQITIDSQPNDPPVAQPDSASTAYTIAKTVNVALNDSDPDGNLQPASVKVTKVEESDPNGSVTATKTGTSGSIKVTPGHNFTGKVVVTYEICDTRSACDTSTLTVTVANNVGPMAKDDSAQTTYPDDVTIDVLANDSDPDDGLAVVSLNATDGSRGTTEVVDGKIVYTPDFPTIDPVPYTDTFTYTICDFFGSCGSAEVTVSVNAPNP